MKELKIKTKKKNDGWFKVDNELVDVFSKKLGHQAFAIYIILKRHANEKGIAWPSLKSIAEKLDVNPRTVMRHIGKLESFGLIEREKRGGYGNWANYRYHLIQKNHWLREQGDKNDISVDEWLPHEYVTKEAEPDDNSYP